MHFVFIHGGPGLNSNPEKNLIKKYFDDKGHTIHFWNEPMVLEGNDLMDKLSQDLESYINNIGTSVNLIGHSFGAKLLLETLERIEDKVESVCLLAPATNLIAAEKYIFEMSLSLLEDNEPEMAAQLKELIPKLSDQVDKNRIEALKLAVQSGYFKDYFVDEKNFENYFSYFQDEYSFDLDRFLNMRKYITNNLPDHSGFKGKSMVIYGKDDPSIRMENEKPLINKSIPDIKTVVIEDVKHYPHIERTTLFFDKLFTFTNNS